MRSPDASFTSSSESTARVWLALLLPCIAVLAAFLWAMIANRDALNAAGADPTVTKTLQARLERWREAKLRRPPVVLFGDSLNMCADRQKSLDRAGRWMRLGLIDAGRDIDLFDLSTPGLEPLQFYALLDRVLIRPIDLVVIEVNLRVFMDRVANRARHLPQLVSTLGVDDAYRVRADLERHGMSIADPALMRAAEQLGLLYAFDGLRQIGLDWLALGGLATSSTLGLQQLRLPSYGPAIRVLGQSYVRDYARNPVAQSLRAIVGRLRAENVPFLLYVAPVDVASLPSTTGDDPAALAPLVEELRLAVGAAPREWLDLHALLPSTMFRDRQNHLSLAGCPPVGDALALRVRDLIFPRSRETPRRIRDR